MLSYGRGALEIIFSVSGNDVKLENGKAWAFQAGQTNVHLVHFDA